jgi:hypothetical protein
MDEQSPQPAFTDWIAMISLLDATTSNEALLINVERADNNERRNDSVSIQPEVPCAATSIRERDQWPRNDSLTPTVATVDEEHHRGIYWHTPAMMVLFFMFGLACSIAHHVFYSMRNGDQD